MRLPYINSIQPKQEQTATRFLGLDERLETSNETFSRTKNLSDRFFPAAATRKPRGISLAEVSDPNGLCYKNGWFYVDGTKCFYNGNEIEGLTVTDGRKQLVGMGAYVCIFPDGKLYNTFTGDVESIEESFTVSSPLVEELSTDSVFTKINATGIGSHFANGDGVTISGVSEAAVDGSKVITEIADDYIVVNGVLQTSWRGTLRLAKQGQATKISGTGISTAFRLVDIPGRQVAGTMTLTFGGERPLTETRQRTG
jgi:hypothetical protein